jgi:hypothetical protein
VAPGPEGEIALVPRGTLNLGVEGPTGEIKEELAAGIETMDENSAERKINQHIYPNPIEQTNNLPG